MTHRLPIALTTLALLASCGEGGPGTPTSADKRTASGEVLEGTISDAMLPLDTLKSQAPLATPAAGADKPKPGAAAAPATDPVAEAVGADTPVPAEAPQPGFGE